MKLGKGNPERDARRAVRMNLTTDSLTLWNAYDVCKHYDAQDAARFVNELASQIDAQIRSLDRAEPWDEIEAEEQ